MQAQLDQEEQQRERADDVHPGEPEQCTVHLKSQPAEQRGPLREQTRLHLEPIVAKAR